jgi:hypothetical protein
MKRPSCAGRRMPGKKLSGRDASAAQGRKTSGPCGWAIGSSPKNCGVDLRRGLRVGTCGETGPSVRVGSSPRICSALDRCREPRGETKAGAELLFSCIGALCDSGGWTILVFKGYSRFTLRPLSESAYRLEPLTSSSLVNWSSAKRTY